MKRDRGFSLMEVMVVIVITMATLLVGIPYVMQAFADYRANNALRAFEYAIQRARYLATSQNQLYCLVYDNTGGVKRFMVFPDRNWNFVRDAATEPEVQSFFIGNNVNVPSVDFGKMTTPSGAAMTVNNVLAFQSDGTMWQEYSTNPPQEFGAATGTYSPKIVISASFVGAPAVLYVYVQRFGALVLKSS